MTNNASAAEAAQIERFRSGDIEYINAMIATSEDYQERAFFKRLKVRFLLPQNVVRLVIAARIVAFEDQSPEALRELDQASEAFAEVVPWDDEPVIRQRLIEQETSRG